MEKLVKKPSCKLVDTDGNVFMIIGNVVNCLKKADMPNEAVRFRKEALECHSYDAVLILCCEYVNVK
jgi:hypothetical protein